jgi:hypothetical protein
MSPMIRSFQRVDVWPASAERLDPGDIVIADVGDRTFLHRVSQVDRSGARVEIADARGNLNGWTSYEGVLGICVGIDGRPLAGAADKARDVPAAR